MRTLSLAALLVFSACEGEPSPARPDGAAAPAARPSAPPPDRTPAPESDSVLVGDPPTLVPGPLRALPEDWTVRTAAVAPAATNVATLRDVRTGTHDGFDRVVFVFDGDALPGIHVEYVDRPAHACGSGEPVFLDGEGWLAVRFQPAQAHTEDGAPTVAERRRRPALPALRELALTCDFEADVSWVLGLTAPAGYRTAVLRDPLRLVVDVRHGR